MVLCDVRGKYEKILIIREVIYALSFNSNKRQFIHWVAQRTCIQGIKLTKKKQVNERLTAQFSTTIYSSERKKIKPTCNAFGLICIDRNNIPYFFLIGMFYFAKSIEVSRAQIRNLTDFNKILGTDILALASFFIDCTTKMNVEQPYFLFFLNKYME